jgi:hypothetical protein
VRASARQQGAATPVAIAAGFGGYPERPRLRLVSWKPIDKGSLRGFASVELPSGLKIHDCPVLRSHGKARATLPSKPQLDKEGRQKTGLNGKPAYSPEIEWRTRDLADRFSAAIVDLVRAQYPDAVGGP